MALTVDRNTPYRNGDTISAPVAASTVIYAGALVCADASGNAVPGTTATTLTYLGRASEHIDNSEGSELRQNLLHRRRRNRSSNRRHKLTLCGGQSDWHRLRRRVGAVSTYRH
jgi:hypothetical protein